jgi:hypothetical protein
MNIKKQHNFFHLLVMFMTVILVVTTVIPAWPVQANGSLAPSPLAAPVAIYGDSLASNWQDWSWDATRNFGNSSPVQSGSKSISVAFSKAWAAIYLRHSTGLSTAGYTHLEFYIHGGTSGSQRMKIIANNNTSKTYSVTAPANSWGKVSVPLADLGSPAALVDLWFQDATGTVIPKFYIDSINLVDLNTTAPTPTAVPSKVPTLAPTTPPTLLAPTKVPTLAPTLAPTTPPTAPTSGTAVYTDQLASGWQNWSWNTSVNLAATSPVQSGSRSIAATFTSGWAALYLHTDAGISTAGATGLRFWVHGGSTGGQRLVIAANKNNNAAVQVSPKANLWTQVDVSLSALGSPAVIYDLWWHDSTGGAQAVFYIDTISLISNGTTLPTPTAQPTTPPTTGTKYFTTLPPGSKLPSDAECAAMIKRRPENKRMNPTFNNTLANQKLASDFFSGGDSRANTEIAVRVTGNFTGTTDEILQWAACKWGIDEDIVRSQAAQESWWQQTTLGDWTTNSSLCAPGFPIGANGTAGQCPESFGILQNRYPYEKSAWPGMRTSTAFNADVAYAHWRACYEGYETWLNQVERGKTYGAGDTWGCVGRWFAGRWYTAPANDYINKVKNYLNIRVWEQAYFQEP